MISRLRFLLGLVLVTAGAASLRSRFVRLSHRLNLMKKLGLHNTAELVLYAVRKKILRV